MQSFAFAVVALFAAVASAAPLEPLDVMRPDSPRVHFNLTLGTKEFTIYMDRKAGTCGGDGSIKVNKLVVPDVVRLPGNLDVDFDIDFTKDIHNFAVDLKLEKKVGLWIKVPCTGSIGSCLYEEICTLYHASEDKAKIDEALTKLNLPSICPFMEGSKYANTVSVALPSIPTAVGLLVNGKYKVEAKLYASASDRRVLLCVNMEVEIKS